MQVYLSQFSKVTFYKDRVGLFNLKQNMYILLEKDAYEGVITGNPEYNELKEYLEQKGYITFNKPQELGIEDEKRSLLPQPELRAIYLEVTTKCNLKCKTCFAGDIRFRKEMSFEKIKQLLDKIKEFKPLIHLSGGEPLLRRDIIEILWLMKENGIPRVILYTNGILLTREKAIELKRLIDSGFDLSIQISLDGIDSRAHDAIRGKGAFDKTVKALDTLKELDFPVSRVLVKMTPTFENVDQIPKFEGFVKERFGFNAAFSLFEPSGSASSCYSSKETNYVVYGIYQSLIKLFEDALSKLENNTFVPDHFITEYDTALNGFTNCMVGQRTGYMVTGEGDVYPCSSLRDEHFYLGNFFEEGNPLVFFDRFIPPYVEEFDECKGCAVKFICGGQCYARNYVFRGALNLPSPYCKLYKVGIEAKYFELIEKQTDLQQLKRIVSEIKEKLSVYADKLKKM